jgi:hypothetical protein
MHAHTDRSLNAVIRVVLLFFAADINLGTILDTSLLRTSVLPGYPKKLEADGMIQLPADLIKRNQNSG